MGNKSATYHIILLLLLVFELKAEIPDTIRLEEIQIVDRLLPDKAGYKVSAMDSLILKSYQHDNLSTILSLKSPVFIKNYGPGNIATSSFRGANASHTQVQWNGVNINSPMLGQVDFSQIPISMVDEIVIYHGGASVSGNNGAIGGTVNIYNNPKWDLRKGISLSQEFGSFGKSHSYLSTILGANKIQSQTRIIYNRAQNNFPYKLPPYEFSEEHIQQNAAYESKGIVEEIYYRLSDQSQLSLISWLQNNYNEIPSTTNDEMQYHNSLKTILGYQYFHSQWNIKANFAHLYDYMNYQKAGIRIDSKNETNSWISNLIFTHITPSNHKLKISGNYKYHSVISNNFNDDHYRKDFSTTISWQGNVMDRIEYYLAAKNQIMDETSYRFIAAIGTDYQLNKRWKISASYNLNYHYPTLNDLFWEYDGNAKGNPDLQPEKGYSAELGTTVNLVQKRFQNTINITGFYSEIEDWILWQYGWDEEMNQIIWFPKNIRQVERKGLDFTWNSHLKVQDITFQYSLNYQLVKAINKTSQSESDNSINKQLIYVPENLINGSLSIMYRKYSLHFVYNFIDKRYTTTNNSDYLARYHLLHLKINRSIQLQHHIFSVQAGIYNIANKSFQVVSGKPMPGRILSLTLKYHFYQK